MTDERVVAWKVTEPNEGYSSIVFAPTRGRAKVASDYFDGSNFLELTVKRTPMYDEWTSRGEVPKKVLLANGWWWTCYDCRKQVTDEDGSVVNGEVYCGDHTPTERTDADE
jgi:hypothetical protein